MTAKSYRRFIPHTEPIDGFVTAQQVRDIRAQLRRMSEPKAANVDNTIASSPSSEGKMTAEHPEHKTRVDTEHRGVTGTLILTDVLDEQVFREKILFNF